MVEKSLMDQATRAALDHLVTLIQQDENIQNYQNIAAQVQGNQALDQLQADLKTTQKLIVNDQHYGKPKLAAQATKQADALKSQLEHHPLTQAYRNALSDANELITQITERLETTVNDDIQKEG
ncbi:YlbF family regulator [Loigolactobacillus bifermentans]|uniref:Cell fate regulator YmcA, YheA/YmcA/DUF963 family (Controls sporulation, competence, biofilm development) n=1 Tax=Loigolactobacillus bifermentans DSM 20003 TaxID=1423726 RepID=A0A0R1H151_9LACO|nr:YlbF family regulator [Loigolactobacillus bifermentans]KRK40224.1 hypothetical protein FC07_GL001084 [Loigolactobacillus bifermentans DSM 20003]QGG61697.1 hypothetical protein LB003_15175 [Loigolactobacillus bifermentans]